MQTVTENETFVDNKLTELMNMTDNCGSLSKQICQYLAHHGEIRDLINLKLQVSSDYLY